MEKVKTLLLEQKSMTYRKTPISGRLDNSSGA